MQRRILFLFGNQTCVPEDPLRAAKSLLCSTTVMAPRVPCGLPLGLVDCFEKIRFRNPDTVIESARALHATSPFHAVVGYDDQVVPFVSRVAAALKLPGHPVEAADAARDKLMMKQRFVAAGLPIAPFHLAQNEDDAVSWANDNGYPVVVKPIRGSASQGVIRANDEPTLRQAYRRLRRIVQDFGLDSGNRSDEEQLIESYLDGSEYSAELLVEQGQPRVLCQFEKPQPLHGPYFEETIYVTPPRLTPAETSEIDQLAIRAVQALGLFQGLAHCEIRRSSRGPFVLEVGARLIGGACSRVFRQILGEDIHPTVLRLALGESVRIPKRRLGAAGAMMLPIPRKGRVTAVNGLDAARSVPGIGEVILSVGPGDAIVPFPEQSCYIGFLTASGESTEDVCHTLQLSAGAIEMDLSPLLCEYWTRDIHDYAAYQPPADLDIRLLRECSHAEALTIVLPLIADTNFNEYPRGEALEHAKGCLEWLERGSRGETAPDLWMVSGNDGVALGSAEGETCYISCLGVRPSHRRSGVGRALVCSMMALFAERGCSTMRVLLDPGQPAPNALYQELGFSPEVCAEQTCCCG
jgi:biotin carboxylase